LTDEVMMLPSVEWSKLDDEIKDLSIEEMAALQEKAKAKFDIPQDKTEAIVEKAICMGWKAGSLVKDGFELADLIKAAKEPDVQPEA
jgi:hypothetical protein